VDEFLKTGGAGWVLRIRIRISYRAEWRSERRWRGALVNHPKVLLLDEPLGRAGCVHANADAG